MALGFGISRDSLGDLGVTDGGSTVDKCRAMTKGPDCCSPPDGYGQWKLSPPPLAGEGGGWQHKRLPRPSSEILLDHKSP